MSTTTWQRRLWRRIEWAYQFPLPADHKARKVARRVLAYMAFRGNDHDEAWPAQPQIMADLDYSETAVKDGLKLLVAEGALTPVDWHGKSNRYKIVWGQLSTPGVNNCPPRVNYRRGRVA